jgi:hypothetical protein
MRRRDLQRAAYNEPPAPSALHVLWHLWSSAAAYALGQPDALLAENAEYLALASSPAQRQEVWQRFLLADDRREAMVRRGDWAIGDDDFRQRVLLEHGRPAARGRGRPPKPNVASAAR